MYKKSGRANTMDKQENEVRTQEKVCGHFDR